MSSKQKKRIRRLEHLNQQTLAVKLKMMERIKTAERQAKDAMDEVREFRRLFSVDWRECFRDQDEYGLQLRFSKRALQSARGNPFDLVVQTVVMAMVRGGFDVRPE